MRRFIHILVVAVVAILTGSCSQSGDIERLESIPSGFVKVSFRATPEGFDRVDVRSVDPDGLDIHTMDLFCFSNYGLFITTINATLSTTTSTAGTFEAIIPEKTHRIHFVANHNANLFDEAAFRGKSEAEVMAAMEGASSMMIYWARFVKNEDSDKTIDKQLQEIEGGIKLLRNHAKVSIANWTTDYLNVTGFVTTNRQAFGTVCPYSEEEGFVWPGTTPYVTLPENRSLLSDITDVDTAKEDYIFESKNDSEHPVSVIIRGSVPGSTEQLYYRIVLIDEDGDRILVRRNFSYVINIVGALTYGQKTFAEALTAPATNNVWVSIDPWVDTVADDKYTLSVPQTHIILPESAAGTEIDIAYTITPHNGAAMEDAEVVWTGENTVANHTFASRSFNSSTGDGSVKLQLLPMGDNIRREGTLLIKKGRLQRMVDVIVLKNQSFTPSWVGTQIFGGETGQFVTLMFTIPQSCPEELFPFDVLVSVNSLDIRASSGMSLPVIIKGDSGYGADNEYGYKYVYTVEKPGPQRIYFHTILTHDQGDEQTITIEADFFKTLTKVYQFTERQYAITLEGLSRYNKVTDEGGIGGDGDDEQLANDEDVLYRLVPQKRNAPITFDIKLINKQDNTAVNAGDDDEFMVYSKSLDFYDHGHEDHDALFYPVSEQYWSQSTNGRVFMFMLKNPTANTGENVGKYTIHLKTNTAVSEDIVRLASNQNKSYSALPLQAGQTTPEAYTGNTYRSVIFELTNYHPFRFAAQVGGEGEYESGQSEIAEIVSELVWTYVPNQNIEISFDVTSFKGRDGLSVDPFGEPFEIYINAPMLSLDSERLASCNLNADKIKEVSEGLFVYTVDADRDAERAFGSGVVLNEDTTDGANQRGESKRIPFVTKSITSAGTITISSNKDKVVFYDKQFRVRNELITGTIKYQDDESGSNLRSAAEYDFVSFARTADGVRIGRINVGADGQYTLNLRSEYHFNWYTDEIVFNHIDDNGNVYQVKLASLAELYANRDVVLTKR